MWVLGIKSGSSEEQPVLLATEASLQPIIPAVRVKKVLWGWGQLGVVCKMKNKKNKIKYLCRESDILKCEKLSL